MANPDHLAILKEGIEIWNTWRHTPAGKKPDLSSADLAGTMLGAAKLFGANLTGATLNKANLEQANLRGASVVGADLRGAVLIGADLSRAKLMRSDLRAADLRNTMLRDTDFAGAAAGFTIFSAVDLSEAKGLETVHHVAPSTIGIDTIYRSRAIIPHEFLRGAGVPEPFITHMKALVGAMDPIQFYSCFISYSTKDQDFADRLYADLQNKGVRCWFAPHDIQSGKKVHEQIDEAIRVHDKLLLILSANSVHSEWVNTEIAKARKREVQEKRRMLFPVRLVTFETLRDWEYFDADTGKDSAREIREFFIPDFSRWKDHDSYQTAFERLLSDLKAEAGKDTATKTAGHSETDF